MYPSPKSRYFLQSLAKGLNAIQKFVEAGRPVTISELAHSLDTTNTTATRICYTLSEMGFIQKNNRKEYRLTPKILTLGYPAVCGLDWQEIAKYYLEQLLNEVQESVSLSIGEEGEILYIIRITKREYLPFDLPIGAKLPVYATAMGKVLMALGPPGKTAPVLGNIEFRRLTAHTINRMDRFLEELEKVRRLGYAVNDEELSLGGRAVAAPVVDKHGFAVAAINIGVPTTRYTMEEMETVMIGPIMRTAEKISEDLQRIEAKIE